MLKNCVCVTQGVPIPSAASQAEFSSLCPAARAGHKVHQRRSRTSARRSTEFCQPEATQRVRFLSSFSTYPGKILCCELQSGTAATFARWLSALLENQRIAFFLDKCLFFFLFKEETVIWNSWVIVVCHTFVAVNLTSDEHALTMDSDESSCMFWTSDR